MLETYGGTDLIHHQVIFFSRGNVRDTARKTSEEIDIHHQVIITETNVKLSEIRQRVLVFLFQNITNCCRRFKNFKNVLKFGFPLGDEPEVGALRSRRRWRRSRRSRRGPRAPALSSSMMPQATADQQNFGKMLLVFGCIGTDLCKQIRV